MAHAEQAEVLAKLRIEKANIEAEEKILECCSLRGSSVSCASKAQACSRSVYSILSDNRSKIKTSDSKLKSEVKSRKSPVLETCAPKK